MELKLVSRVDGFYRSPLLIVPYGIETIVNSLCRRVPTLLIVPYGIETYVFVCFGKCFLLLIVPYGIETEKR